MKKKTSSPESFELPIALKKLSLSTQILLDTYKNKNFEYISYKDFKKLMSALEQINEQLQQLTQKLPSND